MHKKIFYGWWIVLASSVVHLWGAGFFHYSFTAFFNPLVQEFNWSYAATSFAISFRSLESGIAAPIVGFLSDKVGPTKLMLIGSAVAGVVCVFLSRVNSLWTFYAIFILVSVGSSLMFPLPGWTAVANWFSRKRATAMGILMALAGVGGVLIPLVTWLIAQYGWRVTFVFAGVATWIICLPLSLLVRRRPEQYGYLPDGEEHLGKKVETKAVQTQGRLDGENSGLSVRQAVKTRAFWLLAVVATLSSSAHSAVSLHIMPALLSVNMEREVASSIAASVVLSSIAGRLGYGWLGDRMDKRHLLASALLMQALGLIIFAYTRSVAYAIAFLALFGPGFGGMVTLRLALQGDYFGRKAFGAIQGMLQGVHLVGTMLSPVLAGWVYDVEHSYQWVWLALGVVVLISVPLTLTLKPPKQ